MSKSMFPSPAPLVLCGKKPVCLSVCLRASGSVISSHLVDLGLIQTLLIRSGRLSNLTGNATDAHAAAPARGMPPVML